MDFAGPPSAFYDQWSAFWPDHPDTPAAKRQRQSENGRQENGRPDFPSPLNPRMNPPPVSVPGGRGTTHIFYKTRLCASFSKGTCKNGDTCNFAHGVEDLRYPPPNWQELVGGTGGRWGEDQRRIQTMKICKKFFNGEECPYGVKCNFLHERRNSGFSDEGLIDRTERMMERESSVISIGVNGGRIGGGKVEINNKPPAYYKPKAGERSHFDHAQKGLNPSRDEVDMMANPRVLQGKPLASPVGGPSPIAVISDSTKQVSKEDEASRWKLNKKINRIYGDWIDDLTPPRSIEGDGYT